MQYLVIHSLLALATVLPTYAFTNGTLIPAYFCNPKPDGMPKSLGQLIPFLQKEQDELAFNANATSNIKPLPTTGSDKPGNAGYILASLHNSINKIVPINPGLGVTIAGASLTAGVPNLLTLSSLAADVALLGALIYARDAAGVPQGTFKDNGTIFVPFAGCGKNAQGQFNGVVHSATVDAPTYTQLSYIPPKCGNAPITLGGLSVTDNGFGVWNVTFPVTGGLALTSDGKCTGTTTTVITAGTGNTNTETITTLVSEILAGGVPGPLGVGIVGTIPAVASKHVRGSSQARSV